MYRIDYIESEYKIPEVFQKYFPAGLMGQDKKKNPGNLLNLIRWRVKILIHAGICKCSLGGAIWPSRHERDFELSKEKRLPHGCHWFDRIDCSN